MKPSWMPWWLAILIVIFAVAAAVSVVLNWSGIILNRPLTEVTYLDLLVVVVIGSWIVNWSIPRR